MTLQSRGQYATKTNHKTHTVVLVRGISNKKHFIIPTTKNFIETTRKLFTFDVSTSITGFHQKKLVLGLLLPVLGATS